MSNANLLTLTSAAMAGAEKLAQRALDGDCDADTRSVILKRATAAFNSAMLLQIGTEKVIAALAEAECRAHLLDDCDGELCADERTVHGAITEVLRELGQATKDEIISELDDELAYSTIETAISTMRSLGLVVGMGLRFKPAYWALVERGVRLGDIPSCLDEIRLTQEVKRLYAEGHRRSDIAHRLGLEYSEVVNFRLRDGKVAIMVYDASGARAVPYCADGSVI